MTLKEGIKRIWTGQNPPIDIWHYLVGNYRYKLYYSKYIKTPLVAPPLMRQHIWEQINYRISVMDRECYMNGQCKICQCATTQLQMSSKRCEGVCYPTMMVKKQWERFKTGGTFTDINGVWVKREDALGKNLLADRHIFYKETINGYVPINKETA